MQRVDRDTQKCAFKCCYAEVQGKGVNVYKEPITDKGKMSKKGRLTLEYESGKFTTVQNGKGDPTKARNDTVACLRCGDRKILL